MTSWLLIDGLTRSCDEGEFVLQRDLEEKLDLAYFLFLIYKLKYYRVRYYLICLDKFN